MTPRTAGRLLLRCVHADCGDLWRAYHTGEDPAAVAERQGLTVADAQKYVSTYRRRAGYGDYLRETI